MGWLYGHGSRRSLIEDVTRDYTPEDRLTHSIIIKKCTRGNNLWSVRSVVLNPKVEELYERPLPDMSLLLKSDSHMESTVASRRLQGTPLDKLREEIEFKYIALHMMRRGGDGVWGYKDLDESCGPNYVNCPISYLDVAQPAPSAEYAVRWRQGVKDYYGSRRAKKAAVRAALRAA